MITLTLSEVADATGGRLVGGADGQTLITAGVVADSREVEPGGLFVALPGERVDGHDFAAAALAAGSVAVLAARDTGVPAVLVADPLTAIGALARAVRNRLPELTVVGVTGSSGKTSTKDLIATLLAELGPTVSPTGSFNNELGAPLTTLRCTADTRFLVAEMGARALGHVSYLCDIARPRIAVVLNVGAAHAGEFGSRAVTARAKGELPASLPTGGLAVLNADDAAVRSMPVPSGVRVVLFGEAADAEIRADDVRLDAMARPGFRLTTPEGQVQVQLRLHGIHHVSNALAAATVAREAGLGLDRIAAVLSATEPVSRWRMEVTERADGVLVVNDAYNANPESMRAALKALAVMGRSGADGPRTTWAVLGEMLELGDESLDQHEEMGRFAPKLGLTHVLAVGEGPAHRLFQSVVEESYRPDVAWWAPDVDAAFAMLAERLAPGDIVLVKASRAIGLDRLAQRLLDPAERDGAPARTGAAAGEEQP